MSKNATQETTEAKLLSLPAETQYAADGIVSRTLLQTGTVRVVLFGFSTGQELTEHTSSQQAIIQVLTGECDFAVSGQVHRMKAGDLLYMPPNAAHSVKALTQFSMVLTLCRPAPAK